MAILNTFISKLETISPIDYAKNLFKEHADIGTAVVSVLSNTGIAGFKFHLPEKEQVRMQSEITDYYTDNGQNVQDHIARQPITITLSGLQGEYFYSINQFEDKLALVVPTLKLVTEFLPKLSPATIQIKTAYNNNIETIKNKDKELLQNVGINTYYDSVSLGDKFSSGLKSIGVNGVDLFKLFQELYKLKSAQTRAFFYFQALWQSNQVFTVETTWKRYDNMVIQSLQPVRDNNADITEFTITFKQINFVQSVYTSVEAAAGRTKDQLSQKVNKGVDKGEKVDNV